VATQTETERRAVVTQSGVTIPVYLPTGSEISEMTPNVTALVGIGEGGGAPLQRGKRGGKR
jgi:hypothetical protein